MNVRCWFNEIYEFRDGICKLVWMMDFVLRKIKDNLILFDFYILIELVKLIIFNFKSKVKRKYVKWLFFLEDEEEILVLMN